MDTNIQFQSLNSAIATQEMLSVHADLYNRSAAYKEMVDFINSTGTQVDIVIANPGDTSTASGVATTSVNPNGTIAITIPPVMLQTIDYYTDYANGVHQAQSLERVLAHEMAHAKQYADPNGNQDTNDPAHEWEAVHVENTVMTEYTGEAPRDTSLEGTQDYNYTAVYKTADDIYRSDQSPTGSDSFWIPDTNFPSILNIVSGDPYGYGRGIDVAAAADTDTVIGIDADYQQIITRRDPLVIDLDGDGSVSLTGVNSVYFDIDKDGFAEAVSWVNSNDGFLAYDINGNGRIESAQELFGDADTDGFEELATYDFNDDGVIDSQDGIWNSLQVWQDLNTDGQTQSDELFTMANLGFQSITLPAAGGQTSTITSSGGSVHIQNVDFDTDDVNTIYAGEYVLDMAVLSLPTLRGYSTLADLHIAISVDSSLMTQVQDLADNTLYDFFDALGTVQNDFTQFMYEWAGVDNVSPTSRGVFMDDARKLEFLETMLDENFFQARFPEPDPLSLAALQIMNTFEGVRDQLLAKFIVQAGGDALFSDTIIFNLETDELEFSGGSVPTLSEAGLNAIGTDGASSANALAYWANVAWFIEHIRGSLDTLTTTELTWLDTAVALSDSNLTWNDVKDGYEATDDLVLVGDVNVNTLTGGLGDDDISGLDGNDTLDGGDGNDVIAGGDGNDLVIGGDGHDELSGGAGDDTLRDGAGSDLIEGGLGNDTYIWQGGTNDFIFDEGGTLDVVQLGFSGSVTLERMWNDDLLIVSGSNTLTIQNQLNDPTQTNSIEEIRDVNGNLLLDLNNFQGSIRTYGGSGDDIIYGIEYGGSQNDEVYADDGNDTVYGGDGNDWLNGQYGNDTLIGGAGDDNVTGEYGNDTYIYTSGHDVYYDAGGSDALIMDAAFSFADIDYYRDFAVGGGQTFSIDANNSIVFSDIEYLQFENGDPQHLIHHLDLVTYGTQQADEINPLDNTGTNDTIYGYGGDDEIWDDDFYWTTSGVDRTVYISGDDFIDAGEGDDLIFIATGNDTVYGGLGNDIIKNYAQYNMTGHVINGGVQNATSYDGDGSDTVDYSTKTFSYNISVVTHGLSIDISDPSNGWAQRYDSVNDVFLEARDTLISIENVIGSMQADIIIGSAGDNDLRGWNGDDVIYGGAGDDYLDGEYGDDLIVGGEGDDLIDGGGGLDIAVFSGGYADYTIGGTSFLTVQDNLGNDGTDIIETSVEILRFADGEYDVATGVFTYTLNITGTAAGETLDGNGLDNIIDGLAGDDTINGLDGNDTLIGGLGDDNLNGGNGTDTASYENAVAAITADLTQSSSQVSVDGDGGSDTLSSIENILGSAFNDAITGDANANQLDGGDGEDTIQGGVGDDVVNGDGGADTLYGWDGADIIHGGDGNDTIDGQDDDDELYGDAGADDINGGSGNDEIYGGAGNDNLLGGGGHDTIYGGAGDDIIDGVSGNDALWGEDGNDTIYGGTGSEAIMGGSGNDTIYGNNGNDYLHGEEGNDTIYGNAGRDFIYGEEGADILYGGGADNKDDRFIFEDVKAFQGVDTVKDFATGEDKIDISDILDGFYTAGVDDILDFVSVSNDGTHTTISVDQDGTGSASSSQDIAVVENVIWSTVAALQGDLLV